MSEEYVTYQGLQDPKLTLKKCLELQNWILDPDSRPYETKNQLVTRSAGIEINSAPKKYLSPKEQLELTQRIIEGVY